MDLEGLLKDALAQKASDIHLKVGEVPVFRVYGKLQRQTQYPPLSSEEMAQVVEALTDPGHREVLKRRSSVDLGYSLEGKGRFRVNIYRSLGTYAIALRVIREIIPDIRELNLPEVVERIALEERGLVLVTGTTGSGKSTTLAAMIERINTTKARHIVTIEDPVEYLFQDKKSVIHQREVGFDTPSFLQGLVDSLREDPDVILVGEMRDLETISAALLAAETGHLVFSTLHTLDARETVNRVVSVFPPHQQELVRIQLASVLRAVISQRLLPRKDGRGLVPAVEIMVVTPRIRDLILQPERLDEIPEAIAKGFIPYGMQTFDQSLFYLWKRGLIDKETALEHASEPANLELRMKGFGGENDEVWRVFEELALLHSGQKPRESKVQDEIDRFIQEKLGEE